MVKPLFKLTIPSLDRAVFRQIIKTVAMTVVRTILVALVALSVAALPVAGGMARAAMTHQAAKPYGAKPHHSTAHAPAVTHDAVAAAGGHDCCPDGKPCDQKPGDCGSKAACALKCFNFSGATAASLRFAATLLLSGEPIPMLPAVTSRSDNPPLPPPRV